ncbi:hypothetical protein PFTANZ_06220, partial [Plasmodium falciparum Tanzania (2000708)]
MTPRRTRRTVSDLSARDVLEKIGLEIYKEIEKTIPYNSELIGTLWKAQFLDGLRKAARLEVIPGPEDSCGINHLFHTNINTGDKEGRNPCHGREKNRFDENAEAYCNSDKIRVIGKGDGTACAPFRRQNMCDKNLEYLINENTKTTHDLLGNVLVTAKYEGESIVKNHPNTKTSDVCTALARSFADIGDIVRGRDMFKSNEKVEYGLRKLFKKIHENLRGPAKSHYADEDGSENYYKLREDWWKVNRDQVWKAITCEAPQKVDYFRKGSNGESIFSDNGPCGRNETDVPTNLDYVPQFLRWYDEWAEDFCRIRNHKLKNVKKECRDEENGKYCSGDGEDCEKIVRQDYNIRSDLKCPNCAISCKSYEQWLKKKEGEFNKQKKKYEKEINNIASNSDRIYDNKFYTNLKQNYGLVKDFVATLKEAPFCNNNNVDGTIDFNKTDDTFSSSKYCDSCPPFGVICENGTCTKVNEDTCSKIKLKVPKRVKHNERSIKVDVLVTDDRVNEIPKELENVCNETGIFKGIRKDQWSCKYLCDLDVCDLNHNDNNKHIEKRISIRVLFKRWIEYFLKDYSKLKKKLNSCTNIGEESICINECKNRCVCAEKWAEEKMKEWKNVRKRFFNQYHVGNSHEVYEVRSFINGNIYPSYIQNALNEGEGLETLKESDTCYNSDSAKKQKCEEKDVITILIDRLKKKIDDCKIQHDDSINQICCDELPESTKDDDDEEEEGKKKKNSKHLEETKEKKEQDDKNMVQVCEEVKKAIAENDRKPSGIRCNPKGTTNIWNCDTQIHINHTGACMPPRRKSLCIRALRDLVEKREDKNIDDYKNAFTECASIETHLLWKKYKTPNMLGEDKLKVGEIPEDFKRIMYYTFGDYRDIFLGTDISSDTIIKMISDKVKSILEKQNKGGKENIENIQKIWWDKYKTIIWKGMLCGLTYDIQNEKKDIRKMLNNKYNYPCDLETFSKKPQFLRWFIEWAEDFCKQQKKELVTLQNACPNDTCTNKDKSKEKQCSDACTKYKGWLSKWKENYQKQSKKYAQDKIGDKYKSTSAKEDVEKATHAYQYLHAQLQTLCKNGDCKCMEHASKQSSTAQSPDGSTDIMPASLDDVPNGYEDRCKCPDPPRSACDIVKELFEKNDKNDKYFNDACSLKYIHGKEKNIHWKCINDTTSSHSGKETTSSTSTCIPPRRQKLYVGKLHTLSDLTPHGLRQAFIESAAIETFFSWHKFKMDKNKEIKEKKKQENGGFYILRIKEGDILSDQDHPQNKLKKGDIPEEFKRQMFYTFGDYKDIFFGKDMGSNTSDVESKIKGVFRNTEQLPSGNFDDKRKQFWKNYGSAIWDGMVCSLSYDTDTRNVKEEVRKNLVRDDGKIKSKYQYNNIENDLEDITSIPQFIRWFEEWAEEFCRKRKIKLEKVKEECRGENDSKHCSVDGHDCTETDLSHYNTFIDLHCPRCGEECMKYKKWMEKRQEEFNKQKRQYENEINKFGSKNYDKYYEKFSKKYTPFDSFVETLKEGPHCSIKFLDGKLNFKNSHQTFGPSEYCKACPVYGVNCYWGKCRTISENTFKAKKGINGENKNDTNPTDIKVLVLGRKGESNDKELEHACKMTDLFEHSSVQKWTCRYLNQTDQCNIDNFAQHIDIDQVIAFNELFQRWLRYFVQDYNKMKDKINPCVKKENRKEQKCIKDCKKYCICVGKWLEIKEKEWKEIKKHYYKYSKSHKESIPHWVMSYFEQLYFDTAYKKAQDVVEGEVEKEKLWGCTGPNKCKPEEEQKKEDFIGNLIDRLQKKINDCQTQHEEKPQSNCAPFPKDPKHPNIPDNATEGGGTEIAAPAFCGNVDTKDRTVPKKDELCEKGTVNCEKVKKNGLINVPMDPKMSGEDHLNEVGENHNCGGIMVRTNGEWKSTHDLKYKRLDNRMYVSPRRQKFCVHHLDKAKDEPDLKNKLLTVAANQGYNLAIKYEEYRKHYFVPPCHALKYSFYDYQHMILGKDPLEPNDSGTGLKLKKIFNKNSSQGGEPSSTERQQFWNKYKSCVWEAMKCGYNQGKTIGEQKAQGKGTKNDVNNIPDINGCTNNTPTEFDNVPQFLMWFTEWSEDFCYQRKEQLQILQDACKEYECNEENMDDKKKTCEEACQKYQKWLQKWKDQYEEQTAKFDKDKEAGKYEDTSAEFDVAAVSSVHEYLQEQLKNLCTKGDCACMEKSSAQDEETELLGENYFPETMDYPPQEIGERCKCAIPSEPMSCVEQIAKHLREKAEKNVKIYKNSLKGKPGNFNNNCNQIDAAIKGDNGSRTIDKSILDSTFASTCELSEKDATDPLEIEKVWECNNVNKNEKNMCFSKRRQHICIKKLENMKNSVIDNNEKLLNLVMEAAKNEAIHILKNMKTEKKIKLSEICDAMKYSFADIGDIIRGRSNIEPNKDHNIEEELQKIFSNLKTKNPSLNNINLMKFREKWWDANRRYIWKAMTCNAPKDAHLKKKTLNNSGHNSHTTDSIRGTQEKCGHNSEPPDYDYIPEHYRFLQEWSEYYCKSLNKKKDEIEKECPECLRNGIKCEKEDKEKCKECNDKCKEYKNIVDKWQSQFEEQNEIYKNLYIQYRTYGSSTARRNPSIKFTHKLYKICENPDSAEKYLDKSTHCTDYKFSETNSNGSNYAFSKYPTEYEKACKCNETPLPTQSGNNLISFIKNSIDFPHVPGLTKVTKIAPQIPKRIKNISPDAHTIHAIVARSFDYFVPKFPKQDKLPPTHNILNDVLPSAIP